jgi:hypothetical protein
VLFKHLAGRDRDRDLKRHVIVFLALIARGLAATRSNRRCGHPPCDKLRAL